MNRLLSGKLIAALIIGLVAGLRIDHNNAVWGRRGREAFLAHQEHLFNRYSAVPHTSIGVIVTSIITTCLFLFFYELLVVGALRIIKAPTSVFTEK
ncbi:hypothetical protein [Tunturiibacter lichenicola]|uniref:hypothetical protein n=1 Tax=Tunturiibacter lichenicola TaxID=2051959 RepID=UPI0021B1ACAB|nr:hypothetical protein [Edaphobacter lichenicola]